MIREKGQDFYVFEPAMLVNHVLCIPYRWYMRSGVMRGWAWRMVENAGYVYSGWIIDKKCILDIAVSELSASFPYISHSFRARNIPDPRRLLGKGV